MIRQPPTLSSRLAVSPLGHASLTDPDTMTKPHYFLPLRSLGGTAVLAAAALTVVSLSASCGVGLAGGASAASSGGDAELEGVNLDLGASLPVLSLTQFQEPTRANEMIPGAVPAEPSNKLTLQFSGGIESDFSTSAIRVEIKRPGGAFIPVSVVDATATSSRTVEVTLDGDTLHNSLYRVRVAGLMSSANPVQVPTTNAYFVVRDGEWRAPEFLTTAGGGHSGGVTIAGDLEHYSTLETFDDLKEIQGGALVTTGKTWSATLLASEFGDPWLFSSAMYRRNARDMDQESGLQPQTGSLVGFDEVGLIRIHESHPRGPESVNKSSYLRVAVGLYLDDPVPEQLHGYQFGPIVTIDSKDDVTGLVDRPGAAFGPTTDHFSFNGTYAADGRSVAATFWGMTELDGNNEFTRQKVYANTAIAAPFTGSLDSIDWAVWGPATELSDPTEDHNSWPTLRQLPDGSAVAMWWSGATLQDVLDGNIAKYWLSRWTASSGWGAAVDVSPSAPTGPLGMITDLRSVVGPNGNELVVFSRSATGPAVTHLDLTSMTWGLESKPVGTTTIPASPMFADFSALAAEGRYRNLLGDIRRTTPKATPIGNGEFIVRWVDSQSGTQSGLYASIYRPAQVGALAWDTPVDLTSAVVIDPMDPVEAAVDLLVDRNGWATLIYREREDPSVLTSNFQVFARRANLAVNNAGASAFVTTPPLEPVMISTPNTDVSFPSASNVHSSGAFSLVWTVDNAASSLARFQ